MNAIATNPAPKPTLAQALANASEQLRGLISTATPIADDQDELANLAAWLMDASADAAKLEAPLPVTPGPLMVDAIASALATLDPGKDGQGYALRALAVHYGTATEAEAQAAIDEYATDEIEIDDHPLVSRADDGFWTAAWLWTAVEPTDEDEGDDTTEREPDRDTDQHGNTAP